MLTVCFLAAATGVQSDSFTEEQLPASATHQGSNLKRSTLLRGYALADVDEFGQDPRAYHAHVLPSPRRSDGRPPTSSAGLG